MSTLNVGAGETATVNLLNAYPDQGWSISGGIASHEPCNPGIISLVGLPLEVGESYAVTYEVTDYVSGMIYPILGGNNGASQSANGKFTDTLVYTEDEGFQFYSDGRLSVAVLVIESEAEDALVDAFTIAFNEQSNRFSSYYSFVPEMYCTVNMVLFSFLNGAIWRHEANPLHNNFYGVQYNSRVQFVSNMEAPKMHNYYNIKLEGDSPWGVEIVIPPNESYPRGMRSRIKKNNFSLKEGVYWADFLRDLNDPSHATEGEALFRGRLLRGPLMLVSLENTETKAIKLKNVFVFNADSERNF